MATWEDVARACLALPSTVEVRSRDLRQWKVADKLFAWERPLRRRDLDELGEDAPSGPVLGARVPDEGAKQALIAEEPEVYFTVRHFDGYPAVLVRLDRIDRESLVQLAGEAWACRAPRNLLTRREGGPPNG